MNDDEVKRLLEKVAGRVTENFSRTLSDLFGLKPTMPKPFDLAPRLILQAQYMCVQGIANQVYQGTTAVAAEKSVLDVIFPNEASDQLRMDALGEYLNNVCANLMSERVIVDAFGYLVQTPPVCVDEGEVFFPRAWCLQGTFLVNGEKLSVGTALKKGLA